MKDRDRAEKVIDALTEEMENYTKEQTTAKVTYNNKIGVQQKTLEDFETIKQKLSRDNEENTSNRLKKTSEHGQILMTIDSLFQKVTLKGKDLIASNPFKDSGNRQPHRDFDNLVESEKQADDQLEIIKEFVQNFHTFQDRLNSTEHAQAASGTDMNAILNILE